MMRQVQRTLSAWRDQWDGLCHDFLSEVLRPPTVETIHFISSVEPLVTCPQWMFDPSFELDVEVRQDPSSQLSKALEFLEPTRMFGEEFAVRWRMPRRYVPTEPDLDVVRDAEHPFCKDALPKSVLRQVFIFYCFWMRVNNASSDDAEHRSLFRKVHNLMTVYRLIPLGRFRERPKEYLVLHVAPTQ